MVKYSILMSVYKNDNPLWLDEAIDSMLKQTISCNQFVIIQDGAITKEIGKILKKYKEKFPDLFKIIALEKNVGLGEALRIGVTHCDYEYIARMDSDDYSVPNRIEQQLKIITSNPKIGIVGSNVYEFIENIETPVTRIVFPENHDEIVSFSKKRCPFRHPAVIFRKSKILEAGNYAECYLLEDYDMYLRMIISGSKCYNVQNELTYVRINKDFYKRRGGLKYFFSTLKFKTSYFNKGYFTFWEYIFTTVPHLIVILMPNTLRDWFYKIFLRESINE
ncbi:TPA: glycosyltransferase [Streptococcus suis]